MNARTPETALVTPATPATVASALLPTSHIAPSLSNPRKTRDVASFKDLVASIKQFGVLQHVLARAMPASRTDAAAKGKPYELVFGHRRLAAAIEAKAETIPVMIRDLNDLEVLEIQIVENLQREDVHPLEEAEGYERLMQQINPTSKAKHTAEEIGTRIGKSRRYVYNRLKLLDLCTEAREAFYVDKIDTSRAYLLARIGHHDTQREALKHVFLHGYDQPNVRKAQEEIERLYMLDLKHATFDIKLLDYRDEKGKPIAGACTTCPKRSGNAPDLFGDIKSANTCTDIKCFHAKREAAARIKRDALTAAGKYVITGKAAKAVFPNSYSSFPSGHLKEIDKALYDHNLSDNARGKTYKQLLGKDLPITYVENPHTDQIIELVDQAAASKLLKAKGFVKAPSKSTGNNNPNAMAHRQAKASFEIPARIEAWKLVRPTFEQGLGEAEWKLLASLWVKNFLESGETEEALSVLRYYDAAAADAADEVGTYEAIANAMNKIIGQLTVHQVPRFLFECAIAPALTNGYGTNQELATICDLLKRHGHNPAGIEARLKAEAKAKAKEDEKAAKAAAKTKAVRGLEPLVKPIRKLHEN